ncbi:OstA-like protein [Mucilaginibacter segetis]|uniref:Organic solvent tolerance-like N-terminal domain-containing protein n=1 Tax=Mucilaginibacter segetis TaxID=2793071 RepID=A0A934PR94_9SPHI|nr:OstA-like protein [Mucilaginibacter segetis]MBK0377997.1 hypothetical protein [Mucilaginibacter segetis]
MIKYVLSFILTLITVTVFAQKKSVVNLIQSSSTEIIKINGKDVTKVYRGVFQQDYSIMRSDSAYFYLQDNAFDAFGHVNITQGDTLNIFSDKLNYNGNTKIAVLTDNVKLIDRDATLTTNYLTYNTATRIGTYTGGGKLINKDNTLTSKNGYYFAFSRDAYFRYNVVLLTPDALIKTDTLRYNSGSRIAYFYGPTNIYDTKDKKDTLYTEHGTYDTQTEQAFFDKNNLYKQGTKTLKGDSLFYDRIKGFGRAVKHVVFNDNEQKITLRGDLANYYKDEERTVVTRDPYVVIVTEQKDTTQTDTTAVPVKSKVVKTFKPPVKNTIPKITLVPVGDSVKVAPDTLRNAPAGPAEKIKRDSIYISADTLDTQILTFKNYKLLLEKQRLSSIPDTAKKTKKQAATPKTRAPLLSLKHPGRNIETGYLHPLIFGKLTPKKTAVDTTKKVSQKIAAEPEVETDPAFFTENVVLSDTARVRIIRAYHHAKLFKSDLQAKADSMFYSYSDSTLRCFIQPIIWTQGSQLSADTINLKMKNKKLYTMDLYPSAFIVNVEKEDSTHFNQIAGKKMRGYFKDDKLSRMYISGNAESIYFSRDSGKISGMERSLTSRMRIFFKNNSPTDIINITKPEHRYGPLDKFTEDERILKGFIWKPKERPVSKESIIPSYNKKTNRKGSDSTTNKSPSAPNLIKDKKAPEKRSLSDPPVTAPPPPDKAPLDSTSKPANDTLHVKPVRLKVKTDSTVISN